MAIRAGFIGRSIFLPADIYRVIGGVVVSTVEMTSLAQHRQFRDEHFVIMGPVGDVTGEAILLNR